MREGFERPDSQPDVDAKVRVAAERLIEFGMQFDEVSVALHALGLAISAPIAVERSVQTMLKGNAFGTDQRTLYVTSMLNAQREWHIRADELPANVKMVALMGEYATYTYGGLLPRKGNELKSSTDGRH